MEVSTELPTCGEQGLKTKRTRFVFLLTGRIQDDSLQTAPGLVPTIKPARDSCSSNRAFEREMCPSSFESSPLVGTLFLLKRHVYSSGGYHSRPWSKLSAVATLIVFPL
jgi:hypothetical protein